MCYERGPLLAHSSWKWHVAASSIIKSATILTFRLSGYDSDINNVPKLGLHRASQTWDASGEISVQVLRKLRETYGVDGTENLQAHENSFEIFELSGVRYLLACERGIEHRCASCDISLGLFQRLYGIGQDLILVLPVDG